MRRRHNSPTHQPTTSPIVFGAFGDIHGDFAHARRAIERHPDVRFWVSVGDIATDTGAYEPLGAPVYWIHGNNDNFDALASGAVPADFHYIANGTAIDVGRVFRPGFTLRIAGLGGTFAPTWYETPASDLPHPKKGSARATELADKRRHFVRDEVNACKRLRGVDVFLTHEAAKPFRPIPGGRGPDAGKEAINEVLREMKPRLHLFGHHHRFSTQRREGVESIGLDLVSRSYLTIDAGSLKYVCHANA
jgi:Icc-related predicted phosphoesterase